ncbi:MAG: L,D-transpeptidase [Scytonema sp. PMC 1069.18]|nr:L,D-transpeptidase [Scytonema sp. PMC 1069.18]MEC4880312.1 L,D-transpeptidase [Scytonema sp. PMC 1070.18]
MLSKQSLKLVVLISTVGLSLSPQRSLASERYVEELLKKPAIIPINYYLDDLLITEPTHLQINLSRRQVTLYRGKTQVKSYPIAVGRRGWETPIGHFRVRDMLVNPKWIHPFKGTAIRGGDPENPLGKYWIGFWTNGKNWVGFHGTPNPESVGRAASHGCIRMYNKDIEELFSQVSIGTPVTVVR